MRRRPRRSPRRRCPQASRPRAPTPSHPSSASALALALCLLVRGREDGRPLRLRQCRERADQLLQLGPDILRRGRHVRGWWVGRARHWGEVCHATRLAVDAREGRLAPAPPTYQLTLEAAPCEATWAPASKARNAAAAAPSCSVPTALRYRRAATISAGGLANTSAASFATSPVVATPARTRSSAPIAASLTSPVSTPCPSACNPSRSLRPPTVLKTAVGVTPPGVRIPSPPLIFP
jgi:hypothetical protein